MKAYKTIIQLNDNPRISRTIIIPKAITFNKLHKIICIAYNLDENIKYKFCFNDIQLTIKDTGTINRDNIDARYELIDEYFKAYTQINYINKFAKMQLKTTQTETDKTYPEFTALDCKYNPGKNISVKEYQSKIDSSDNTKPEESLVKVNNIKIQEQLLKLFNIHYTIEKGNILILGQHETLDDYI